MRVYQPHTYPPHYAPYLGIDNCSEGAYYDESRHYENYRRDNPDPHSGPIDDIRAKSLNTILVTHTLAPATQTPFLQQLREPRLHLLAVSKKYLSEMHVQMLPVSAPPWHTRLMLTVGISKPGNAHVAYICMPREQSKQAPIHSNNLISQAAPSPSAGGC